MSNWLAIEPADLEKLSPYHLVMLIHELAEGIVQVQAELRKRDLSINTP